MTYTINELKILEIYKDIKSDEYERDLATNQLVRKHYSARVGARWEVLQIILGTQNLRDTTDLVQAIARRN